MEKTTLLVFMGNVSQFEYRDNYNRTYPVNQSKIREANHTINIYEEIGIAVIYAVFSLLGIFGNSLVIWFGFFRMQKTVNVIWFLSLAISDFSFTFFYLLSSTQILLTYWLFKKTMCKLRIFFAYINLVVSVLQITVISVDRYICVMFPVWSHNHRTPRWASIIVLIIWMISFAVAIPYLIYTDTTYIYNRIACILTIDYSSFLRTTILDHVFFFLLPFVIIVSCYIVIYLHIRKKRNIRSSRSLRTSLAVVIAFFICWFPLNLFSFFELFGKFDFDVIYYGNVAAVLLMVISSCINPILYAFIGRAFKDKFWGSFLAKFKRAFTEEDKSTRSSSLQMSQQDPKEDDKE